MTDRVSPEQRSRMMAAVRGSDTLPELYVRKRLFAAGFRFRIHASKLSGKPDIVLPRLRTAVFIHGCFWHGHSCPRGKRPGSNVEFWNAKIDGTCGGIAARPWLSSVRSVQAAKPSSEVAVPKADSLVGGGVLLDRLDRLLYKQLY